MFCQHCRFNCGHLVDCDHEYCGSWRKGDYGMGQCFCEECVEERLKTRSEWLETLQARTGRNAPTPEELARLREYADAEAAAIENEEVDGEQYICESCATTEREERWDGGPAADPKADAAKKRERESRAARLAAEAEARRRREPSPDEQRSPGKIAGNPSLWCNGHQRRKHIIRHFEES